MAKGFFPAKKGAVLHMADGGMFDGVKRAMGFGPTETLTQKYARQDAELAAKNTARAQPAPPAATPAPAPNTIAGYAGMTAMQRREKEAGLKNGGDLKTGQGGHVPGTGKGDKIPAKYEPGEFVVSNAMLEANPGLREQLHAARDQVLAEQGKTPEQADAKNAAVIDRMGGADQPRGFKPDLFFADGGDDRRRLQLAQIPTGGMVAPAPDGSQDRIMNGDLGRNVTNTLSAIPGAAPALGAIGALAGASRVAPAATGFVGGLARAAAPVAPFAPPVAGGIGMMASSSPTASAPVTDGAGKPPAPVVPSNPPPIATPSSSPTVTPAGPAVAPTTTGQVLAVRQPNGMMSFSGENVSGPVTYAGTSGFKPGSAISDQNMAAAENLSARSTERDRIAPQDNLIGGMNPQRRAEYLQELALSQRGTPGRLAAQTMVRDQMSNDTARQGQQATNKLAQQKFGLDTQEFGLKQTAAGFTSRAAKQLEDAQAAYTNAKTDAERETAREVLRSLQGKYEKDMPNRYTVVPGGQSIDPQTQQLVRDPAQVLDNQTGEFRTPAQAKPTLPPGMTKQVGTQNGKPVYEDKSGKRFVGA